jgi:hypothetical protein
VRFRTVLQRVGMFMLLSSPIALRAQEGADAVVEVIFTPEMDKAALQRIQEEVKAKGVVLTYEETDFKAGLLHHIAFSVTTPAGSGKAQGEVDAARRPGFSYDPRKGADVPFRVGRIGRATTAEVPVQD